MSNRRTSHLRPVSVTCQGIGRPVSCATVSTPDAVRNQRCRTPTRRPRDTRATKGFFFLRSRVRIRWQRFWLNPDIFANSYRLSSGIVHRIRRIWRMSCSSCSRWMSRMSRFSFSGGGSGMSGFDTACARNPSTRSHRSYCSFSMLTSWSAEIRSS